MAYFTSNSIFNVFDLIIGILLIVAAVASFHSSFVGIVIPIYVMLFGIMVIVMAFYIPDLLKTMLHFYMNFLGRGLTFLFLGCLVLVGTGNQGVKTAIAVITLILAFTYIILWILLKCKLLPINLPHPFMQNNDDANKSKDDTNKTKDEEVPTPAPTSAYDDEPPVDTR